MAVARVEKGETKKVMKWVEVDEPGDDTVVLELTRDEAAAVVAVLGKCLYNGPTQSAYDALSLAGVNDWTYVVTGPAGEYAPTVKVSKRA